LTSKKHEFEHDVKLDVEARVRQGEPVLSLQRMALMTVRWSLHWPPL
jgi:hypothetical protein